MLKMMTRCPNTGKPMFTGIAAPNIMALSHQLNDSRAVGCDHCGDLHECRDEDCWHEID